MKALKSTVLAVVIGGLSFGAIAASENERELAVCASELKEYFGTDTQIKLVSRQRGLYGTQLRVAASQDGENARFASCWVDTDDMAAMDIEEESEQVVGAEVPAG